MCRYGPVFASDAIDKESRIRRTRREDFEREVDV